MIHDFRKKHDPLQKLIDLTLPNGRSS